MQPTIKLSEASLSKLRPELQKPGYPRGELKQHTVHLGVGSFHRAHQALYLDDLLGIPEMERWGECGIGLLKSDDRMRDALTSQDCLYTLVERSAEGQSARVIGSLVDYLYAPEDREAAIEKMAAADTRIVSLTITEGGYFIDDATREFLPDHTEIRHDLQHPEQPSTSVGLIAEALQRRRHRGLAPFTVMSCDNLQGNGHVIKKVLLGFAGLRNQALAHWIESNVTFPSSMVDRITPATTPADVAFVAESFGIEDAWPVVCEPFRQWVVEDMFCNGRPAWQEVGVEFTSNVAPYEVMKMRLLNGSHLAMAYLGALRGYDYVHQILQDGLFRSFITNFMEEVTPIVPIIPGTSITNYKRTLLERFSNPTINDQVTRICSEGSAKIPKWLLPSIVELGRQGKSIHTLSLVVASWILYLAKGHDERGKTLQIIEARSSELVPLAKRSILDPRPLLNERSLFSEEILLQADFIAGVEKALQRLRQDGVSSTVRAYQSEAFV